jgi:hypothetical protein
MFTPHPTDLTTRLTKTPCNGTQFPYLCRPLVWGTQRHRGVWGQDNASMCQRFSNFLKKLYHCFKLFQLFSHLVRGQITTFSMMHAKRYIWQVCHLNRAHLYNDNGKTVRWRCRENGIYPYPKTDKKSVRKGTRRISCDTFEGSPQARRF